jgi:hypothetical protein
MDYQLTIRISIDALDDIEARKMAKDILDDIYNHLMSEKTDKKLQRVYKDRAPEKVALNTGS